MTVLTDVNKLLTGTTEEKLEVIEKQTRQRLMVLLGGLDVPNGLEYIVTEVTVKRFNRLSNEGQESYSQEGLSIKFNDSDFNEYLNEIESYATKKVEGVIRFL